MIDHVSIPVRDLSVCARFYETVLAAIGFTKLADRPATVGFGKRYPEFWLNLRPDTAAPEDSGMHVCLRAPNAEAVDAFHRAALTAGGASDGEPGRRPQYNDAYYAAFVRDPEGNKIEAVTFLTTDGERKPRA